MMKWIDAALNRVTMYRLMVYYLVGLLVASFGLSALHVLPYNPFALMFTVGFLIGICWLANKVFAWAYNAPVNVESVYITALILALIIEPLKSSSDLWFVGWAGVLAMASKYLIAINHKHLFNPAAFAVAVLAVGVGQTASWWIGNASMLPFVLLGGMLIVRKIRRFDMTLMFLLTGSITSLLISLFIGENLLMAMSNLLLFSPLLFFAFVFITEPISTPPIQSLRISYGAFVGFMFSPQVHLGPIYTTPETAILIGNVFSWLVSPKSRLMLRLKQKIQIAPDVWDFIFVPSQRLAFAPGQYMEWTLPHDNPDSRGNRRYFTLASSPTEDLLRVGVKFYPQASSYKQSMLAMSKHTAIAAGQLAGDFTLPDDLRQGLIFIAGGIGITPFRSMLQYLLDKGQRRTITVFYVNKTMQEIVYRDVLDRVREELGIRTIYAVTSVRDTPPGGGVKVGRIDAKMIQAEVPDYGSRIFYISGPNIMVDSTRQMLHELGVPDRQIKTDYFPGLV